MISANKRWFVEHEYMCYQVEGEELMELVKIKSVSLERKRCRVCIV
jgi:hypothetical protein